MAEETTSAEPTQARSSVAGRTQKPEIDNAAEPTRESRSALLWFQEGDGKYVVYHGGIQVVRTSNWGNVLQYAHDNKLPLSFSREEYRVGSFPLEGGIPVPPENWCPADRIWFVTAPPSWNDPKRALHYEEFTWIVDGGAISEDGKTIEQPFKGRTFIYKSNDAVGLNILPAEPTSKKAAEPTERGIAEPATKRPAEPTQRGV